MYRVINSIATKTSSINIYRYISIYLSRSLSPFLSFYIHRHHPRTKEDRMFPASCLVCRRPQAVSRTGAVQTPFKAYVSRESTQPSWECTCVRRDTEGDSGLSWRWAMATPGEFPMLKPFKFKPFRVSVPRLNERTWYEKSQAFKHIFWSSAEQFLHRFAWKPASHVSRTVAPGSLNRNTGPLHAKEDMMIFVLQGPSVPQGSRWLANPASATIASPRPIRPDPSLPDCTLDFKLAIPDHLGKCMSHWHSTHVAHCRCQGSCGAS